MAEHIQYNKLSVIELRNILKRLGLTSSGNKASIVKRLKDHEETLNTVFDELESQYSSSATRQGKILRLISLLIDRYYKDGEGFSLSLNEYPELYNDLNTEDREWFNDSSPLVEGEVEPENSIRILLFMADTIKRVKELERQAPKKERKTSPHREERKVSPRKEKSTAPKNLFTIIVESLDPREIEIIFFSPFERIPKILQSRALEEDLRNLPNRDDFSFFSFKDNIPRKITLKKIVLHS